jgi:hypothetical protein
MARDLVLELRAFSRGGLLILASAAVLAACAAPPAAVSQAPSNTPMATAMASASATAMPAPSATAEPSATPAPAPAFEAPDDILPPWSTVVVVVDALQLRTDPGLSASVAGTASAGAAYQVSGYEFGPVVVDGLDWYRLLTAGDAVIWAAAGSGADRYLEVLPADCGEPVIDLAALTRMTEWDRLACFGDRSLTIEGTYGCGQGCGGYYVGQYEPTWLAYPPIYKLLWLDYPTSQAFLEMRISPDSELQIPAEGSIVRVTGHFSDPVSPTCQMSTGDQQAVDPMTAELFCRERFVVDSFEVIGTNPEYP